MIRAPDCRGRAEAFQLTAEERRELVLLVAEKGPEGLEEFVRKHGGAGGRVARALERIREEVLRKAEEVRSLLRRTHRAREAEVEDDWRRAWARMEEERLALARDLDGVRVRRGEVGAAAVADAELVRLLEEAERRGRPPWWVRAWRWILRAFLALVRVLLAPVRWLLGAPGRGGEGRRRGVQGRATHLGALGRSGLDPRVAVERALGDPAFRGAVRARTRALSTRERMQALWDRMLGREDYAEFVARLMDREVEDAARRREAALRADEEHFARRLEEVLEEEQRGAETKAERLDRLRREAEEDMRRLEKNLEEEPEAELQRTLESEMEDAGLLARGDDGVLAPTTRLVERFAALAYTEEVRHVRAMRGRAKSLYAEGEGNLVREPLLSAYELSRMDTVSTLVQARTRHPHVRHLYDDDVLVYREEHEALNHVVIVFDRSGSMEEHGRMDAAKRAVLALWEAVKRENRSNPVDLVAMDTHVERVDLMGVWKAEPRGFTNTGAALRLAGEILRRSPGDRGLVYLVTDGLPEAYTEQGEDYAGDPKRSLAYALQEARALRTGLGVNVVQILLEPDDETYVKAAERIAKEVRGRVLKVRPAELARTLLAEFEEDAARVKARTIRR